MTKSFRSAFVALAVFSPTVLAGAQTAPAPSPLLAETLFREGKQLMEQKRYDLACAKLAESQRLDPGAGTLLTLALCHEAEGKSATAWSEFHESLAIALGDRRSDRERVARAHIESLEPALSRLTVQVPERVRRLPGLIVLLDGLELRAAAWGVAAPIDPGPHRVEVRATGKKPFEAERVLAANGATETIDVSELEDERSASTTTPPRHRERPPKLPPKKPHRPSHESAPPTDDAWRTAGWISGGAGVLAIGVGSYFGLRALSKASDADERCPPNATCRDPEGINLNDDAGRSADVATVSFVVGGAALAFAGYALFFRPGPTKSAASLHRSRLVGFSW